MKQSNFSISSVSGKKLFGQIWEPEGQIDDVVILVHGFGEHCSRYTSYFQLYEKERMAFISMDHIGHGCSEGKRGVIQSYQQLLNDIDLLIDKAESYFPNIPKSLYGHSMGGNLSLNYLLQRNYPFKKAIISSPWLRLYKEPNVMAKFFIKLFNHLLPNITVKSGLDSNNISSQKEEVQTYQKDPLNHGYISFRLLNTIMQQGLWAMKNIKQLKTPTLLVHGNKDHVTSYKASKCIATNHDLINYIEFDKMYHEIHNDECRQQLASTCINWIKQG